MTVGGDRVDYSIKVATKKSELPVTKAIIISDISTKVAVDMNTDIKNYYLGMTLGRYEYINIAVSMVPERIMEEYILYDLVHDGYLYVEV
jgi:hypothetical protein